MYLGGGHLSNYSEPKVDMVDALVLNSMTVIQSTSTCWVSPFLLMCVVCVIFLKLINIGLSNLVILSKGSL